MIKFDFLNNIDFSTNINENFIYNFYENSESESNNDIEILNNNINAPRYIQLDISTKAIYDRRLYNSYRNSINLNSLRQLSNKMLTKSEKIFFNKLHDRNKNSNDIVFDKKDDEIEKINNFLNIDKSQHSQAINFIKRNHKVSINKNQTESFLNKNNSNFFMTENVVQSLRTFENDIRKNNIVSQDEVVQKIKISEGFVPIHKHSSYAVDSFYYLHTGHLVEKYEYNEDLEQTYFKSSSYYKKEKDDEVVVEAGLSYIETNSLSIKDNNVRYGSTYFYVVYPVFVTTLPNSNDYNLINTYLFCDYPYITKKIKCEETKRPSAPSFIKLSFINNKLKITWNKPVELQGDIKGYQVFKRENLNSPYQLIHQIEFFSNFDRYTRNEDVPLNIVELTEFHKTEFVDLSFKKGQMQIYTICSLDARGYSSNYGTQLGVVYDNKRKKCIVDTISKCGAPLHMPNLLIPRKTKFFDNDSYIVTNTPFEEKVKKISVYVTPECYTYKKINSTLQEKLLKDNYKLNIYSLENGENLINEINIEGFTIQS